MRRSLCLLTLSAGALVIGCEAVIVGSAIVGATQMTYEHLSGEGTKVYNLPYRRVVPAAEQAGASLGLYELTVQGGEKKTTIQGRNVDGERVRIRVLRRDRGKKAEVLTRCGPTGDYLYTTLVFDAINESLGLPPEEYELYK
jgi:hypothetical protein